MYVDFGDAYVTVCTKSQFLGMLFTNSPSVFRPSPAKSEVCVHGELLSSLRSATPARYTATF